MRVASVGTVQITPPLPNINGFRLSLVQCPRFPVARAQCHRAEAELADFQACLSEANRFQKKSPYLGTTLAKTFSVSRPLLGSADNFFGAAIAALCGTPPE